MSRRPLSSKQIDPLVYTSSSDEEYSSSEEEVDSENNHDSEVSDSPVSSESDTDELVTPVLKTNRSDEHIIWALPSQSFSPRFNVPKYEKAKPLIILSPSASEIESFKLMFPTSLFILISNHTNERLDIYNRDKNARIPHTDSGEIMIILGVLFVMCYNRVPNQSDYWSNNVSLGNSFIKKSISRNRFQILLSKMYFNDPAKPDDASKLYYVEELVNCFKHTFPKAMSESTFHSIDESMVKFKGRSSLKQYLPLKPIKRGIKIWERCDAKSGYTYDLNIYEGKDVVKVDGTLGERVVNKLCDTIHGQDVIIAFDRFFTSINTMRNLPFPAIGTCIKTRKNIPKFQAQLKRGESEFRVSKYGIVAARWMDSKEVIALSNCHQPVNTTVKRKQKDGNKIDVNCPEIIAMYNEIMGGVDLSDQKVSVYDLNRKALKWWKKVFYKLMMTAAVNGHIVYQEITKKKTPFLPYLVNLAEQLVMDGRQTAKITRKTPSIGGPRSKRSKLMLNIGDHMPEERQGRRRCIKCSQSKIDKRTKYVCSACEVPLCQACFTPFHN